MKNIQVSTKVFSLIWSNRQEGEESENDILERILSVQIESARAKKPVSETIGFYDTRYGILFPEGFEIFRNYKDKNYKAVAANKSWRLIGPGTAKTFPSLNKLSQSIINGNENAWINWSYRTPEGREEKLSHYRSLRQAEKS